MVCDAMEAKQQASQGSLLGGGNWGMEGNLEGMGIIG